MSVQSRSLERPPDLSEHSRYIHNGTARLRRAPLPGRVSSELGIELISLDRQLLDFSGPVDVWRMAGAEVHAIWKDLKPIKPANLSVALTPTTTFEDCPPLDCLCVPGGQGVDALQEDDEVLEFIRVTAAKTRFLTSVCTGSLVLGAAGLLNGKKATSHWSAVDLLAKYGAEPVHARYVRDGDLITGGGVTAGIDSGLAVLAALTDDRTAQLAQLGIEYAPEPPFDAGSLETAPPDIVAEAKRRGASRVEQRAQIADRAAARLRV